MTSPVRVGWADRHKFALAFGALLVFLVVLVLVVGLGGKGGESIHPGTAPAGGSGERGTPSVHR